MAGPSNPAFSTCAGASALQLDPKLTWLAPGTTPQLADPTQTVSATQLWFQSVPSRQAFVSRLLTLLVLGPFPKQQSFCEGLLVVEASHTASKSQKAGAETRVGQLDVDKAREAAKKLLAAQRGNLGMWAAYAGLESQARQHKVGFHSRNSAPGCMAMLTLDLMYCYLVLSLFTPGHCQDRRVSVLMLRNICQAEHNLCRNHIYHTFYTVLPHYTVYLPKLYH